MRHCVQITGCYYYGLICSPVPGWGGGYGWSEDWVQCGCLGHRNLLLGGCLGHALAIGVALVNDRIEAGGWMTNALVKREEESKGIYCSYKHRSWAMPSSLLHPYCAWYEKVGVPEKFPWGERDAMKSQQTEREFVCLGTGSDRRYQGVFVREEEVGEGTGKGSVWSIPPPKSLQSCPTLCDPIDGSPQGSAVPGILQARTLEWVAISFSNAWKWKVKSESEVAQSCPTLRNPMNHNMPGSSAHGIFQARVLEWGAIWSIRRN